MKGNKGIRRVGLAAVVVFILAVVFSCAALQPKRTGVVKIDPAVGVKAAKITITGSGFQAGEEVDVVFLLGPGQRVGLGTEKVEAIIADDKGNFKVDSGIPMNAKPGKYTVEVEGSKGTVAQATVEVTVK